MSSVLATRQSMPPTKETGIRSRKESNICSLSFKIESDGSVVTIIEVKTVANKVVTLICLSNNYTSGLSGLPGWVLQWDGLFEALAEIAKMSAGLWDGLFEAEIPPRLSVLAFRYGYNSVAAIMLTCGGPRG